MNLLQILELLLVLQFLLQCALQSLHVVHDRQQSLLGLLLGQLGPFRDFGLLLQLALQLIELLDAVLKQTVEAHVLGVQQEPLLLAL